MRSSPAKVSFLIYVVTNEVSQALHDTATSRELSKTLNLKSSLAER